jgi:hypothetical protein
MTTAAPLLNSASIPTKLEYYHLCQKDPVLQREAEALVRMGDAKSVDDWVKTVAIVQYELKYGIPAEENDLA